LRTILNYFQNVKKIIPSDYQYPFGKGGFSIKSVRKKKTVLTEEEILSVIELNEFDSWKQEYARDIWMKKCWKWFENKQIKHKSVILKILWFLDSLTVCINCVLMQFMFCYTYF
jgi:hypothetical protein